MPASSAQAFELDMSTMRIASILGLGGLTPNRLGFFAGLDAAARICVLP